MSTKHRVKISVRVERGGYKRKYAVVKETLTPLPPHGIVILGTFTQRNTAEAFRKAASDAYNHEAEIAYRKMRGTGYRPKGA